MLQDVNLVRPRSSEPVTPASTGADPGLDYWADTFTGGSIGSIWTKASWLSGDISIPAETSGRGGSTVAIKKDTDTATEGGLVADALALFAPAKKYRVELFIEPFKGAYSGSHFIFARMDSSSPVVTTDGISLELVLTGTSGAYSGELIEYVSGSPTTTSFTAGTIGSSKQGWFAAEITADALVVKWQGVTVLSKSVASAAGPRFGFGLHAIETPSRVGVDTFRLQYHRTDERENVDRLVVGSAGGGIYKQSMLGVISAVSVPSSLSSDRRVRAAERAGKLYIADHGDPRVDLPGGVIDSAGTALTSASVPDFTTLGIDTAADVVVLTDVSGDTNEHTSKISSVTSSTVTLSTSAGGAGTANFRIERAPKVFDPLADTLVILVATSGKGQAPTGCPLISEYRDRIVMAGAKANPNVWYMSRQEDPLDWDYFADDTDVGRAAAGDVSEAGIIGEPITALMDYSDDAMVFGCENSLWLLRGDPVYGGQIDNLSRTVGVISGDAWTTTPDGMIVFLSRDGLYSMSPGSTSFPKSMSREKLPLELRDIETSLAAVSLAFDPRDRGVHIYVTPVDDRPAVHYWFDWETGGFWPMRLATGYEPTAVLSHMSRFSEDSSVLLGGRDSKIRRFHARAENDDGDEISSHVVYGPLRPGGNDYFEGVLNELIGTLGVESGSVTVEIQSGLSVEEAVRGFNTLRAHQTFTLVERRNYKMRPRVRGSALAIKFSNLSGTKRSWAIERIIVTLTQKGRERRLGTLS